MICINILEIDKGLLGSGIVIGVIVDQMNHMETRH